MQNTPALSRTWRTHNAAEMDGVVIHTSKHTVTLARPQPGAPMTAQVDGQPAALAYAVALLEGAYQVEKLAEQLPPVPTIGKARAAQLHRLMGRAGVPSGEHYGFAGAALDRPVFSLAALSEADARQVWRFLASTFPSVRQAA